MKVIVDTNIAFSAVLNTNGRIGDLLFNSGNQFTFYTCNFLKVELETHKPKLVRIAKKMAEADIEIALARVMGQLILINDNLITEPLWIEAKQLVEDVDIDDLAFVALANQLNAVLWTGDKVLYKGLRGKGYTRILNTDELWGLRIALAL